MSPRLRKIMEGCSPIFLFIYLFLSYCYSSLTGGLELHLFTQIFYDLILYVLPHLTQIIRNNHFLYVAILRYTYPHILDGLGEKLKASQTSLQAALCVFAIFCRAPHSSWILGHRARDCFLAIFLFVTSAVVTPFSYRNSTIHCWHILELCHPH